MCGMFFDAADQLKLHRMRYCQGSALHQAMLATREENRGAVAARLEEDPLHLLNTNLASLGQEVDGISVGELRARIAKEATERKAQREAREAAITRAEARMTEQRAKAESQRQLVLAQLEAQRLIELETKVQLRAAERMAEEAELRARAKEQEKELANAEAKRAELDSQVAALAGEGQAVQDKLMRLRAGMATASEDLNRAKLQNDLKAAAALSGDGGGDVSGVQLSDDAFAERRRLLDEQAKEMHAMELKRAKLKREQREREQELLLVADNKMPDSSDIITGGSSGDVEDSANASSSQSIYVRRLQQRQREDEQRLLDLQREIELQKAELSSGEVSLGAAAEAKNVVARASDTSPQRRSSPRRHGASGRSPGRRAPSEIEPAVEPSVTLATGDSDAGAVDAAEPRSSSGPDASAVSRDVATLREQYSGANPELMTRLERLQSEVDRLQHSHSQLQSHAQPQAHARGRSHAQHASGSSAAIAAQLAALQKQVEAQEAETNRLEAQLQQARRQRLAASGSGFDSLSDFADRVWNDSKQPSAADGGRRPTTQERLQDEFHREAFEHDRRLAKLRHERELLEEEARLKTAREEAKRAAEEQRVKSEHDTWMREQKRKLVEARVQREVARNRAGSLGITALPTAGLPGLPYDPGSGFVLFWDFAISLPWSTSRCVLVYAIYDGEKPVGSIKALPAAECEKDVKTGLTRCLLGARRQFLHLGPSDDLRMVVELQQAAAPNADIAGGNMSRANAPASAPKTTPLGWCSLPLFTPSGALNAGFWRLQLLQPPISIAAARLAGDPSSPNAPPLAGSGQMSLCLRCALTADMERNAAFAIDPDQTLPLYTATGGGGASAAPAPPAPSSPSLPPPPAVRSVSFAEDVDSPAPSKPALGRGLTRGSSTVGAFASLLPAKPESPDKVAAVPPPASPPPEPPEPLAFRSSGPRERFSEVLGVDIHLEELRGWIPDNVGDYVQRVREGAGSMLRVHVSVLNGGQRLPFGCFSPYASPDPGGQWRYSWHESVEIRPPPETLSLLQMPEASLLVELVLDPKHRPARPLGGGVVTGRLSAEDSVEVTSAANGDEGIAERGDELDDGISQPVSTSVVGWAILPLFDRTPTNASAALTEGGPTMATGRGFSTDVALFLNSGQHTLLLSPPPVDFFELSAAPEAARAASLRSRLQQLPRRDAGNRGELSICISSGGRQPLSALALLDKLSGGVEGQRRVFAPRSRRNNLNVPPTAWLSTEEPNIPDDQQAYDGRGAILVIDGARFLPDDVVASGIRASLVDENGTPISSSSGNCLVLSDARMPKYHVKLLLTGRLPANATLTIAVNAVVAGVEEAVTLGFGVLPLFVRLGDSSLTQPVSAEQVPVAINTGSFQLPLLIGSELALQSSGVKVSEAALKARPRIPCASVLVRVLVGPAHAVSSASSSSQQAAILAQQSIPDPPSYMSGEYDSSRTMPLKNEVLLFKHRLQRPPLQCIEAVQNEAERRDQDVADVDEADKWLDRHLDDPNATEIYDLLRFAPYDPAAGLQVAARRAAGLPFAAISYAALSLYPPAATSLYAPKPREVEGAGSGDTGVNSTAPPNPAAARVRVSETHDWSAQLRAPVWLGKGAHLPAVPREEGLLLVVDIRCLEKPTNANSLKAQGWGVLPVFLDSVVDSGLHQIPLFAGSPTLPVLAALSKAASEPFDTWQTSFGRVLKEHNVAILDQCSATITLLDAQRFGELDTDEALQKTPDRDRLPVGFVQTYLEKLPHSKPLSSLVGKVRAAKEKASSSEDGAGATSPQRRGGLFGGSRGGNRGGGSSSQARFLTAEEIATESLAAFKQGMGLV